MLNMMFFSSNQMCCSAETSNKLISPLFLRCFMKVAFFRVRQSKHQIFAESIKFEPAFSIEMLPKNRLGIDFLEQTESDLILNWFWTPFSSYIGIISEAFGSPGAPWLPCWVPRAFPGRFPEVCLALLGRLRISNPSS